MDETASISAESFSSETTEGIPEAKEKKANDGIGGENKNDIKESQASEIIAPGPITDSGVSDTVSLQKEPLSSLEPSKNMKSQQSNKSNPPKPECVKKGESGRNVISKGKGQIKASNSIQTSLIWEFTPDSEVLSKSVGCNISDFAEKGTAKENEVASAGDTGMEHQVIHEYYVSPSLGEEERKGDHRPAQLPTPEPKAQNQQAEGQVSNKIPSLLQIDAHKEETTVWIHPKTGKEMKSSLNQTNVQWEKKPLAEVLRRGAQPEGFSWESGNGGVSPISQRIHVPYNPDDPEWAGYPNPFEY